MSVDSFRSQIARLSKDHADLQKTVSDARGKIAKLNSEIGAIRRGITKSTSPSMLGSKSRQIELKEQEIARTEKILAVLLIQQSNKAKELNRAMQSLERAEGEAQKKLDAVAKKRRDEELLHLRNATKENEKQYRLQTEMGRSHLVIDIAKLPRTIKVIFFAANPLDQQHLRLDEEIRAIEQEVRLTRFRDSVEVISRWAVRPEDLLQALNEHEPHIVHFSGHGSTAGGIVVQDANGDARIISLAAIVQLMKSMVGNIRIVVFNSCFSNVQAEAVTEYIDVAIGMNNEINDEAARVFAAQFYSAIGFGRSVQQSFDQAITALMLQGIPEDKIPELYSREGINPNALILVQPI